MKDENSDMPAPLAACFTRILNHFRRTLEIPTKETMGWSRSMESIELAPETMYSGDRLLTGAVEIYHWAPTFIELDALLHAVPVTV